MGSNAITRQSAPPTRYTEPVEVATFETIITTVQKKAYDTSILIAALIEPVADGVDMVMFEDGRKITKDMISPEIQTKVKIGYRWVPVVINHPCDVPGFPDELLWRFTQLEDENWEEHETYTKCNLLKRSPEEVAKIAEPMFLVKFVEEDEDHINLVVFFSEGLPREAGQ